MLQAVVDFVKGLFGGKGTTQIGKGNQSVSGGSTTGANSPVLMANGDVHFYAPPSPATDADPDAETFAELEGVMPDLLGDLRMALAEQPLVRDVIVLDKKTISYNWPDPHLCFSADETPDLWAKVGVLEDQGLLRETRDRFSYRMSGRLVKYLTKQ
jgi:hypothetical protein